MIGLTNPTDPMPPEAAGARPCVRGAGPAVFLSPGRRFVDNAEPDLASTRARASRHVSKTTVSPRPIAKRERLSPFTKMFLGELLALVLICVLIFAALTWHTWGYWWGVLNGTQTPAWEDESIKELMMERGLRYGTDAALIGPAEQSSHSKSAAVPQQAPAPWSMPRRRGELSPTLEGGAA